MSNINDYIVWRGDIKVDSQYGINDIDKMILSRFSYLIFDKINMEKEETIESISNKMKNFENEDFNYNGDKQLITNLGKSERFKNMLVTNYVKNNDKNAEKQFSAITIHVSDEELFVSFMGTDSTIVGWKEDFNISFMKNVPSQLAGLEYVKKIAELYPSKRIRIGGHSKGGNIAVYSAVKLPKEIQERIIDVTNYDGPGFADETIKQNKNKDIIKKIYTYIPQDSVIGRIMEHEEGYEVVLSTEKGIYQHDIYSWQVMGTNMIKIEKTTDSSERMYKAMNTWLKSTTAEQRKIFFDGVFEIFYSTSATSFSEISENWLKNTPKLIESYRGLSENDRKAIIEMLKLFGKLFFSNN